MVTVRARTRHDGGGISTSCCQRCPRCGRSSTTAALPYGELPAFMAALRAKGGMTALAFEFTILTTARTGEAIGTRWSELDLREKVWTIPASRMKAGREHRVPLSGRAVEILEELAKVSDTGSHGLRLPRQQTGPFGQQHSFPDAAAAHGPR